MRYFRFAKTFDNNYQFLAKFSLWVLIAWSGFSSTEIYGQNTSNRVSPIQTGHYMPGFLSIRDFANPTPASGLMVLDYSIYQYGDQFYGADGNHKTQIIGPTGSTVDLKSDVDGYFNSPYLVWLSTKKILGATYIGGISVPYLTVNTNLAYSRIGEITGGEKKGNVSGKVSGFSDLNVLPIYLSWSKLTYDITAGYMFYAPTGKFELGGSNNTGLGYWSHVFQTYGYWYPEKTGGKSSKAMAVMFGISYEITGDIKDSNVNPGNRFSLDYGIEQYFTNKLSVGIYGGNNWQISKDEGSQVYWNSAVKDRLGVAGVQLGYWLWPKHLQAVGKWGFSYGAIERYQQNSVQLSLVFITNTLNGNKNSQSPGKN